MALDLTKPVASSLPVSAEIRSNFTAVAQSLYGVNVVPNGDGLIWPVSTLPAHFRVEGFTPTVSREVTIKKFGAQSTKIVGNASGDSRIAYVVFNLTDFNTDFIGEEFHCGEWLYSTAVSGGRLFVDFYPGGVSNPQYGSYVPGSSTWKWHTLSATIPATATRILVGRAVDASKTAYFWGLTGGFGGSPPQRYVPCATRVGCLYFPFSGTAAVDADYQATGFEFTRPAFILGSKAFCKTAPVTSPFSWNIGKLTTAEVTYTALYTADQSIAATKLRGDASVIEPTSATYADRCFNGRGGATSNALLANTVLGVKRTAAGGTAAGDVKIEVEVLQFDDPLSAWKRSGSF